MNKKRGTCMNQSSRIYAVIIISAWMLLSKGALLGQDMSKQQIIIDAIEKVRNGQTSNIRCDAAEHLAVLTHDISPKEINNRTIAEIISLLDLPDARFWVAISLGNLKSRAKIATPRLMQLLVEEDCKYEAVSTADGIRIALTRIGVKPPPPNCENKKPKWNLE
jgi:hypothetical protein